MGQDRAKPPETSSPPLSIESLESGYPLGQVVLIRGGFLEEVRAQVRRELVRSLLIHSFSHLLGVCSDPDLSVKTQD